MNKWSKSFSGSFMIEVISDAVSEFGSLKDADRWQFVSCINEETPPGVLKQLAHSNITVYWEAAGISLLRGKKIQNQDFGSSIFENKLLIRNFRDLTPEIPVIYTLKIIT